MKRRGPSLVGAVAITAALAAGTARAEAPPAAAPRAAAALTSKHKLAFVMGLATPWGELGASYQRSFVPSVALETGFGLGATGAQLVLLPKLLLGSGGTRAYFAAGPSLTIGNAEPGLWAAGEFGVDASFDAWVLTFGAGAGILVAGSVQTPICFDACSRWQPGRWLPDLRFSVGRAF